MRITFLRTEKIRSNFFSGDFNALITITIFSFISVVVFFNAMMLSKLRNAKHNCGKKVISLQHVNVISSF